MNRNVSGWRVTVLASFIAIVVWVIFSWPLPRHLTSSIVYVPKLPEGAARFDYFHACDPLQLVYHFWLAGDMVGGGTPLFYNLYEFNTGDDGSRYVPGTYYLPFSLLYALGEWMLGRAFGLNWIGLLSLLGTFVFSVALTRRYTVSAGWSLISALVAIILPYRWHALFGGSPAGLAMTWVPLVMLGLDIAIRDRRWVGGVLAGTGIFLSCMGDSHVFFFTVLLGPLWCLIVAIHAWRPGQEIGRSLMAWIRSLLPFVVLLLGSYWLNHYLAMEVAGAGVTNARTEHEVRLCSPAWQGLFFHHFLALDNQIYVGWILPVILSMGFLAGIVGCLKRGTWRLSSNVISLGIILVLSAVVSILALGLRGPDSNRIYEGARHWIPFFALIRQPSKIFVIMPTLLSVGLAMVDGLFCQWTDRRVLRRLVAVVLLIGLFVEYKSRINPGLFRLPNEQSSYSAVAADARARKTVPRALVVTFWPGNSHETTVFEYYASLYRIRLVNGYRPFLSPEYKEFYDQFSSINQGMLDDAHADDLLKRGIGYILLHEDRYPEVVSPFPVSFTLRRLLESPRLSLIARHDEVWAFRVEPEPELRRPIHPDWTLYSASRHWEAERHSQGCDVVTDPASGQGRYLILGTNDAIQFDSIGIGPERGTKCLLRVRGLGSMYATSILGAITNSPVRLDLNQTNWVWIAVAIPDRVNFENLHVELIGIEGSVHVDQAVLTAGDWDWCPPVGSKRQMPAAGFFHAGHLDVDHNTLVLEKNRRTGVVFSGPKLPLSPGTYKATLCLETPAAPGVALGQFKVGDLDSEPVTTGTLPSVTWRQTTDLSFSLTFDYSGLADVEIEGVTLERLD